MNTKLTNDQLADIVLDIVLTMDLNVRIRGWLKYLGSMDEKDRSSYGMASMIIRDHTSGPVADSFQVMNMGITGMFALIDMGVFANMPGVTDEQLVNDFRTFDRHYENIREEWLPEFHKFINRLRAGEINVN